MQVQKDAGTGRAIVPSCTQRREQRIASQLRHEVAGEPAYRPEGRSAGTGRAGTSFVVVAVADDADPESFFKGIVQEPFKCTPRRMHFNGALNPPIVGVFQIGVSSSDLRDHSAVL